MKLEEVFLCENGMYKYCIPLGNIDIYVLYKKTKRNSNPPTYLFAKDDLKVLGYANDLRLCEG